MNSTGDAGETLVESIISVMFVGLVVTALILAIGTATSLSGSHRDLTSADLGLKTASEAIKTATYSIGASKSAYNGVLPILASPYVASVTSIQCVQSQPVSTTYAVGPQPACTPNIPSPQTNDVGLQLVNIEVRTTSGHVVEKTTVMKRNS